MPIRKNVETDEAEALRLVKNASPAKTTKTVAAKPPKERSLPSKEYVLFRQIIWDIISINNHFEEMRRRWAKKFGVTGPQWGIILAINDLDKGGGVPVGEVSAKIHAVSTFVTTQTKLLEKRGLLKRVSSTSDARVVLMSLSDRAYNEIAKYFGQWGELHQFIFAEFDPASLRDMKQRLDFLKKRAEIASRRIADEF